MPLRRRGSGLLLGLVLLAVSSVPPLAAQAITWNARLGATWTSTMVTDQIAFSTIHLRPTIAPTLTLSAYTPLHTKKPVDATAELRVTTATLNDHQSTSTTRVAGMRTITFTGGVRTRFMGPTKLRVGLGFVSYALSEKEGVFQSGTPIRPLGAAAVEYEHDWRPSLRVSAALGYDIHTFTTKQLEANGYTGTQMVHRVMLSVGVSR